MGFIDAHFDVNNIIIYFIPVFTTVVFTTSFAYRTYTVAV